MAERKTAIARETKIGLFVITVLLVVFAIVVVRRLRQSTSTDDTVVVASPAADANTEQPEAVVVSADPHEQALPPTFATQNDAQPNSHSHATRNGTHYRQAKGDNSEDRSSDRYAFMPAEPEGDVDGPAVQQASGAGREIQSDASVQHSGGELAPEQGGLRPTRTALRVADDGEFNPASPSVRMAATEDDPSQQLPPPEFSAVDQMEPATREVDDATQAYASRYGDVSHQHNHVHETSTSPPPMVPQQASDQSQYLPTASPDAVVTQHVSDRSLSEHRQIDHAAGNYLPQPRDGTYVVKPNDNFWTISEALYGSGNYFKALIEYNRQRHPLPNRLAVGDEVLAPSKAELVDLYPDLCPRERRRLSAYGISAPPPVDGRQYTVQEGDTLFDIARYELGDPSRWVEIYKLNAHQLTEDFDFVRPGTKLILPVRSKRQAVDHVTQQPGAGSHQR
jgi:nucleoid-associated protein YgaU